MEYYSLNKYLRDTFGCKVYKISLNAGLTCPNRDGTIGTGGCIFCSAGGSGEFAEPIMANPYNYDSAFYSAINAIDISGQIAKAKERIAHKNKSGKYIAYFQAYTNTYGPVSYLEKIFMESIKDDDIVAISIATRPDCLGKEILDMLEGINKIKPVWIELGLQTIHESTAKYIRRGYTLEVFDEAVANLRKIGIDVIVHVILGLPFETEEMMLETVKYIVQKDIQGVKLQLLHVLRGTDLEKEYNLGKFNVLTLEEYTNIIVKCLAVIPKNIVIHRITGDGDKKILVAPIWSADKKKVLNTLNKAIEIL